MKIGVSLLFAFIFGIVPESVHTQDGIDVEAVRAREDFRWGVRAYQSGSFSDAILAFEQSLSLNPEESQTRKWLAWAYYRSGYEDTALAIWKDLIEAEEASSYIQSFVETVDYRRGMGKELAPPERYIVFHDLAGEQEEFTLFERPSSIFPRSDAGFYLTSFAGNQVLLFTANGAVERRFLGGLQGLDHPFDVLETQDGHVFISEFSRNAIYRSDLRGVDGIRFGETGGGKGQLIGPQYMADDQKGYLYVTEAGNRRVSKFDYEGNFVLSFGERNEDFAGFRSPTGIAVQDDRVFVADSRGKYIAIFDRSGNFIAKIASEELVDPEGL